MINEIVTICKFLLVNPVTIVALTIGNGPLRQLWLRSTIVTQEMFYTRELERFANFEVNKTRENHDADLHGYTRWLLTPFSFVKLNAH